MAGPDFQTMATINNKKSPREQTFRTISGKTGRLNKTSDQAATDKKTYLLMYVSDTYYYTSRLWTANLWSQSQQTMKLITHPLPHSRLSNKPACPGQIVQITATTITPLNCYGNSPNGPIVEGYFRINMAGAEGFEPPNARIKTLCLTA